MWMLQDQLCVIPALVKTTTFGLLIWSTILIKMHKKATSKLAGSFWILMKLLKTTKKVQLLSQQM